MDWVLTIRLLIGAASAFLVGATGVVAIRYLAAWLKQPIKSRKGLLPLHVFAVALSYDLLLIFATITTVQRTDAGGPLSIWRLSLIVPAIVLGLVAMYVIATFREKEKLRTEI